MEARIYVGWPGGSFLTTNEPNDQFQAHLAEMVDDHGPPTVVEFRAAGEGYVVEDCDAEYLETLEDSITVNALFKWDDYNEAGEPGEARERVTISPEEFDEWGDDDWSGTLMSWASENLDGGLEVSDIEVSPEDEARLTNWIGTQEAQFLRDCADLALDVDTGRCAEDV